MKRLLIVPVLAGLFLNTIPCASAAGGQDTPQKKETSKKKKGSSKTAKKGDTAPEGPPDHK